jgi:methionyl-tRNA formyltransferase
MPEPIQIAYFGLPLGACLLALDGHRLAPCVLSPIEAPGRRRARRLFGQSLIDSAERPPEGLERAVDAALANAGAELLVSWFWTRLLPERWLRCCPRGAIGVHPSLLPRHRGPNPYFWAIDAGDELSGVTLHTLEPEYDRGAILGQRSLRIGERNSWQLARALDRPSLALLREGVLEIARGSLPAGSAQDETLATWAPEPTGAALSADFRGPTERALRRIRALAPVPGLALEVRGVAFFVVAAQPSPRVLDALEPGEAGLLGNPDALIIRTADGAIQVDRAVLAGEDGCEPPRELDRTTLATLIAARPHDPTRPDRA